MHFVLHMGHAKPTKFNTKMKKLMATSSFRALVKGMIDNDAQATVRNLEDVHVGRKTQDRFLKVKAM